MVTIHLNELAGLFKTLQSLDPVLGNDTVEWIVVDGGSSRQADDVLAQAQSLADHFISETDGGIYDAMNKGTRTATGDYVLFLNAGDELHPDFKLEALIELAQDSMPEMVWGDCLERYGNGALVRLKTRSPSWAWYCMPVYHPAVFFRRDVLGDHPYDTHYQIAADYELICRLLSQGARAVKLNSPVSIFHRGGLSDVQGKVTRYEENQVRLRYFKVSKFTGNFIQRFKNLNARLARFAWLRGIWRRWI